MSYENGNPAHTNRARKKPDLPDKLQFVCDFVAMTGNFPQACSKIGVSQRTVRLMAQQNPQFKQELIDAQFLFIGNVESILIKRCIIGVQKPIIFQGKIVAKHREFDNRLLFKWLEVNKYNKLGENDLFFPGDNMMTEKEKYNEVIDVDEILSTAENSGQGINVDLLLEHQKKKESLIFEEENVPPEIKKEIEYVLTTDEKDKDAIKKAFEQYAQWEEQQERDLSFEEIKHHRTLNDYLGDNED